MKLKLANSTRHHQLGIETLNFTVVDDAGKPVPGLGQVSVNAPADMFKLSDLSPAATYQIDIKPVK